MPLNHDSRYKVYLDSLLQSLSDNETEMANVQLELLQFNNVVKYAPGLLYWKDVNSVYQGCNDEFARWAGLQSRRDVKGKTDFELIWKERAKLYVEVDKQVIESGVAKLNHVEVITLSNNKTITAITNKVPMLDNNGQIIGVLGITTDITHQKEIELALSVAKELAEVANHAKTEFIANMGHDIRTPLCGVVIMSQLLIDTLQNPEQKKYAEWLNKSGGQLLVLLNGILDIVSADHINENDLRIQPFDLRQCINDIIELERPITYMKQLDLRVAIDESIPRYINCDRTKLHRIILNLLGNAIKFTDKGYVLQAFRHFLRNLPGHPSPRKGQKKTTSMPPAALVVLRPSIFALNEQNICLPQ